MASAAAHAADVVPDLEAQYRVALEQLKKPATSGVLVTEVDPESPLAATGLSAGDILTEYQGSRIHTLKELRTLVAEVVSRKIDDDIQSRRVLARVRRGDKEVLLSLPRAPLGIRAVEVEINRPGPRNPPPDQRGTITFAWDEVLQSLAADNALARNGTATAAFRMFERTEPDPAAKVANTIVPPRAEETWIGWQTMTASPEGSGLKGTLELRHLDPASDGTGPQRTDRSAMTFRLRSIGDYKTSAAFELDNATSLYLNEKELFVNASAQRVGETFRTAIVFSAERAAPPGATASERLTISAPLDALPQSAVPWVAAAMPQKADTAIALRLLTIRQFIARPGYILTTRGKQPIPEDPAPPGASPKPAEAWRVDLMHSGLLVESYWFSDQRRLLVAHTPGYPSIILRRVASEREASLPMVPATRPATTRPETQKP